MFGVNRCICTTHYIYNRDEVVKPSPRSLWVTVHSVPLVVVPPDMPGQHTGTGPSCPPHGLVLNSECKCPQGPGCANCCQLPGSAIQLEATVHLTPPPAQWPRQRNFSNGIHQGRPQPQAGPSRALDSPGENVSKARLPPSIHKPLPATGQAKSLWQSAPL